MNSRFTVHPVTETRVVADSAEQVAHDVRRTRAALERIFDDLKAIYELASPLVERLKSTLASTPTKVGELASKDGAR